MVNLIYRLFRGTNINTIEDFNENADYLSLDSTDEFIYEQIVIDPNDIVFEDFEDFKFPWHGYTEEDFIKLDKKKEKCLELFLNCKNERMKKRIIRRYHDIYRAYFASPIEVRPTNIEGKYRFGCDGRHRIYAAKKNKTKIPVWVLKEFDKSDIPFELQLLCFPRCGWRMINFNNPLKSMFTEE